MHLRDTLIALTLVTLGSCAVNQGRYDDMVEKVNLTAETVNGYRPMVEGVCAEAPELATLCKKAVEAAKSSAAAVKTAHAAVEDYRTTGILSETLLRSMTRVFQSLVQVEAAVAALKEEVRNVSSGVPTGHVEPDPDPAPEEAPSSPGAALESPDGGPTDRPTE